MVLPKGGSHYEQFVIVQKKEDRISKRKKKEKGQTTLAVEYPNVYRNRFILSTNRFIQTEGYFDRGTTSVDTYIALILSITLIHDPSYTRIKFI